MLLKRLLKRLERGLQPSNEAELCNVVATAVAIDDRPSCFRFPRGNGLGVNLAENGVSSNYKGTPWEVGHLQISARICIRACVVLVYLLTVSRHRSPFKASFEGFCNASAALTYCMLIQRA